MKAAEEMTREELIVYDKWLTRRKWGTGEIISPEKAADLYLAEQPLPPAEGAEEVIRKYCHTCFSRSTGQEEVWSSLESVIIAVHEFATLHAQKIADKMVEERLREELIKYDKYIGSRGWIDNYEDWTAITSVDEYLKSRRP